MNIITASDSAHGLRPRVAQKGDPTYDLLSVALRHDATRNGMAPPLFGTSADARIWLCDRGVPRV